MPRPANMMINEKGMKSLTLQLRSRLTIIFQLSNFQDVMIEGIVKAYGGNVMDAIFEHWDEWEIKKVSSIFL